MKDRAGNRAVKVPPDQFILLMEKLKIGECLLIDVRKPEEHRAERIEGSMNVPVDSIGSALNELDRETLLLVYCRSGMRSRRACDQLEEMGFHRIMMLDGGFEALKSYNRK